MDTLIKVLIVDDHKLIGQAWSSLLKDAPNIQVVGLADNVDDAYSMAHSYKPDIVLMDINLGAGSGFDATEKINDSMPKTRVIGLSLHDDITYVKKFLSIGAKGYLTKNTNKTEELNSPNRHKAEAKWSSPYETVNHEQLEHIRAYLGLQASSGDPRRRGRRTTWHTVQYAESRHRRTCKSSTPGSFSAFCPSGGTLPKKQILESLALLKPRLKNTQQKSQIRR